MFLMIINCENRILKSIIKIIRIIFSSIHKYGRASQNTFYNSLLRNCPLTFFIRRKLSRLISLYKQVQNKPQNYRIFNLDPWHYALNAK